MKRKSTDREKIFAHHISDLYLEYMKNSQNTTRKYNFLKIFYLFPERGEGREKREEKHQSVASCTPPTGDVAHNPGMCPDWELNERPFGSQAGSQSTEPDQPG